MEAKRNKSLVWVLTKLKLAEFVKGGYAKKKSGGKAGKALGTTAIAILYIIGWIFMALSIGAAFALIALESKGSSVQWVYFSYMAMGIFFLSFIGSVFMTESQMFQAKDNERLMAMPIRPWDILVSRMVSLLIWNFIFGTVIGIPAGVVYFVVNSFDLVSFLVWILSIILVPLLALSVSMLAGWGMSILTSKVKNTKFVKLAISIVAMLLYFKFIMGDGGWVQSLSNNLYKNSVGIKSYVPPAYSVGMAIVEKSPLHILLMIAWHVIPFIVVSLLVSRNFLKLITLGEGKGSFKYKSKELKVSSPFMSMAKLELERFLSSVSYILNGGMGLILLCIVVVFSITNKELPSLVLLIFEMTPTQGARVMAVFMALAILGVISLVTISACSISLDANTLWQAKSLPTRGRDYLLAKAFPHIVVSLPFVIFAGIVIQINLEATLFERILLVLIPVTATLFNALLGVRLNAKYPKFNWSNEAQAIKQGLSILLSIILAAIPPVVFMVLTGYLVTSKRLVAVDYLMLAMEALYIILTLWMYLWINRKGDKVLFQLEN